MGMTWRGVGYAEEDQVRERSPSTPRADHIIAMNVLPRPASVPTGRARTFLFCLHDPFYSTSLT